MVGDLVVGDLVVEDPVAGAPHLPRSALLFARVLRGLGMSVATDDVTAFLQSMQAVGIRSRRDARAAARSLFTTSVTQRERFDRAFDRFWSHRQLPAWEGLPPPEVEMERTAIGAAAGAAGGSEEPERSDRTLTWSAAERLRRKDFGAMDDAELQRLYDLVDMMRIELPVRAARRTRPARRGHLIDLRGSLRAGLRSGGELTRLRWRRRKLRPRRLILICDISGSMERYSGALLAFVHAAARGLPRGEAFVFGTRLSRITRLLTGRRIADALRAVADHVLDWGGGTRIGEVLRDFNYRWARRVLSERAVVVLISDGWDRGEAALLRAEIDRLRRSCGQLVWLNPLAGSPGFEPRTRGLQAALPFVDLHLPAHNLAALERFGALLQSLGLQAPGARPA